MSTRNLPVVLASAALVLSLCMGMRQTFGLFLPPMTTDLPLRASEFAFAIALQSLVWGLAQPPIGMLADRFGSRPVAVGGALVYALGVSLMLVSDSAWVLSLSAGVLVGVGIAATSFGVLMGAVAAHVPPERRSGTMGIVAAFGSFGTMFIAPFSQYMIDSFDWRWGVTAMIIFALAMVPGAWLLGPKPETLGASPSTQRAGNALREAGSHSGFLLLTAGFFTCGFQLAFITTHLPVFLDLCGVPTMVAGYSLALVGFFNVIGTYVFGRLGNVYSKKRLLAGLYLLRSTAIFVYLSLPISATSTLIFAGAMGFLWLGTAPLTSALVAHMFGLKHMAMLYGFVFLGHQLGSFAGAWAGGLIFDAFGSYDAMWNATIISGGVAALLHLLIDDRPAARLRTAAA